MIALSIEIDEKAEALREYDEWKPELFSDLFNRVMNCENIVDLELIILNEGFKYCQCILYCRNSNKHAIARYFNNLLRIRECFKHGKAGFLEHCLNKKPSLHKIHDLEKR